MVRSLPLGLLVPASLVAMGAVTLASPVVAEPSLSVPEDAPSAPVAPEPVSELAPSGGGPRRDEEVEHGAHPRTRPETRVLSLREALEEAVKRGPDVLVALAPREALTRAERWASPTLLQPPNLAAQFGPRLSQGQATPEVIVAVYQPLSVSGQGRLQKRVAVGERRLQAEALRLVKIEAAMAAGEAWFDLALAHTILELRQSSLGEAENLLGLAESRVRLGQADPLELAVARSEMARSRALVVEAEGLHFAASAALSLALGLDSVSVEADGGLPNVSSSVEPRAQEEEHWSEARLRAAQALASAQAKLARANQSPGLAVGVQYQREGTGDQIVTGTLTMPLFDFRPGRYQEALLSAEADRLGEAARMQQRKAKIERERAQHEEAHAAALFRLLSVEALPAAREALTNVRAKYELGGADIARVALYRQQLLALEEDIAAALATVHRATLMRLKATGRLLEEYSL